jgi:hypothetical protein
VCLSSVLSAYKLPKPLWSLDPHKYARYVDMFLAAFISPQTAYQPLGPLQLCQNFKCLSLLSSWCLAFASPNEA